MVASKSLSGWVGRFDSCPEHVEIDDEAVAGIIAFAIDKLYYADQEDGCCPKCCAACRSLQLMVNEGTLDLAVHPYVIEGQPDWWNEETGQVDREFLTRAWRMTDCHNFDEARWQPSK